MKLSDFKVLTFDVYGTLIDWESGIIEGLKNLVARADRPLSHTEVLEAHARHESSQQVYTPTKKYNEVLEVVYKRLAEEWGVSFTRAECMSYGQSIKEWLAFPDSQSALQYLKKHYKLVVLTNTDNDSFGVSNEKLGVDFDASYTAEDVGSYKPAHRNFDYMLDKLKTIGIEKRDILHTAESMFHDHGPANRYGLANCWIYRRHGKGGFGATMDPGEMPTYKFHFNSMADLVKAHQEEMRG